MDTHTITLTDDEHIGLKFLLDLVTEEEPKPYTRSNPILDRDFARLVEAVQQRVDNTIILEDDIYKLLMLLMGTGAEAASNEPRLLAAFQQMIEIVLRDDPKWHEAKRRILNV